MSVYKDLVSRDSHRILAAAWNVALSRDDVLLTELALRAGAIADATRGVQFDGLLGGVALSFALLKLKFYAGDHPCPCELYLSFNFFDPDHEAGVGNVVVLHEERVDGWFTGRYLVECTLCRSRYSVMRQEWHMPWWEWAPAVQANAAAGPAAT